MRAEPLAALRALRDCGVLLVRDEHVGLLWLYGAGLATVRPCKRVGNGAAIFQLNDTGKAIAARVLK